MAYYVLCAKIGYRLPGHETVPEQIAADKGPYYRALEAADQSLIGDALNLESLEELLDGQLARQLLSAYDDAKNPDSGSAKVRKLH